jgi:hypothetical protein
MEWLLSKIRNKIDASKGIDNRCNLSEFELFLKKMNNFMEEDDH